MADEQDVERNYPATPRRLEQARERGQVARSRELTTAGVALAAAGGIVSLGPALATACADIVRRGLTMDRDAAFSDDRLLATLSELVLGLAGRADPAAAGHHRGDAARTDAAVRLGVRTAGADARLQTPRPAARV